MDSTDFEKAMLYEKQCRFNDAVLRTSKRLSVSLPEIKFWDGYCPDSLNEEVSHIHIEERIICISNHWLASLDYDEIDHVAVHETTHLIESEHNEKFYSEETDGKENLWHSRNANEEITEDDVTDVRTLALRKATKKK